MKAKILVLTGALDPYAPIEHVEGFRAEMTKAGADWQVTQYSEGYHAFTDPHQEDMTMIPGVKYDPLLDKLSWISCLAMLDATFKLGSVRTNNKGGDTVDQMIIGSAVNGVTPKSRNPNVPVTPQEVAEDSLACMDAGAAVVHTHIDHMSTKGQPAADRYADAYQRILAARPDAVLYATGASGGTVEEKCVHTELLGRAKLMRMGYVDPGSTQLGSADSDGLPKGAALYANPCDEIAYRFAQLERLKLGPNMAMYEPGFLKVALAYHRAGKLPAGAFVKFYLSGNYNYMGGTPGLDFWGLPAAARRWTLCRAVGARWRNRTCRGR